MIRLALTFLFACSLISAEEPERPKFPETFTTDIDVLMRSEKTEMDITLYYDKPNNKAAIDLLFQGERTRYIYLFDKDRVLTIQDFSCTSSTIDSENSFINYVIDPKTKKKTLAPAVESFYFKNSNFSGEDDVSGGLPIYIYKTEEKLSTYGNKTCKLTHRFSKPEVTMAECDMSKCDSKLLSIAILCSDPEGDIDHRYFFYRFRSSLLDKEAFQVPNGMTCSGESGLKFPSMQKYFCFDYQVNENMIDDDKSDLQISPKSLCYDSNIKVLQVQNYDSNGLATTQIYDFVFGAGVAISPHLSQCEVNALSDSLELGEAAELPNEIFPSADNTAVYVGKRESNGLTYDVWSSKTETSSVKEIKEFYFLQAGNDQDGKPILQISNIVVYYYEGLDGQKKTELRKVNYSPVTRFKTGITDWSVYDMSSCYPDKNIKEVEVNVSVSCEGCSNTLDLKTDPETLLRLKQILNAKLMAITKMSVMRTSGLTVVSVSDNVVTFRVKILDSFAVINDAINPETSPGMDELYNRISKEVNSNKISFSLQEKNAKLKFDVTDIRPVTKQEPEPEPERKEDDTIYYTKGSMAGLGVAMVICGGLIGAIILFVYMKTRTR